MSVSTEPSGVISDEELGALALAADPDVVVDGDAVPLTDLEGFGVEGPLPSWYMPTPMRPRRFSGWRGRVVRLSVFSLVASFVAINAFGLCNTYGQLH